MCRVRARRRAREEGDANGIRTHTRSRNDPQKAVPPTGVHYAHNIYSERLTAAADTPYFVLFLISRTSYGVSVGESGDGDDGRVCGASARPPRFSGFSRRRNRARVTDANLAMCARPRPMTVDRMCPRVIAMYYIYRVCDVLCGRRATCWWLQRPSTIQNKKKTTFIARRLRVVNFWVIIPWIPSSSFRSIGLGNTVTESRPFSF